ncbi:Glycosyl transferase, group 1 [Desulfovibrio sp. DV]|uniref:glycosyltransferase n=1 Tax=Desulfovibrio sp. DV TaxID=1844708 RepID=UPI00094B7B60|nr:glycosyltransferase [Desulfovibrio sp. DV]OLN24679.1 Glycosyl transferase, group 1 [Desulfovibrio sp. DV]
MRVLQVGKFYPPDPGGVETASRQTSVALTRLGMAGEVLCFAGAGPYDDASGSVPVTRAAVLATVSSQPVSLAYITALRAMAPHFDVFHVHCPNILAALALYLVRPRGRIVLHWHSDIIGKKALLTLVRPLETWLCRRADLVIGPTAVHLAASDRAADFAGKGAVVPFCVDETMAGPHKADPAGVASIRARFGGRRIIFALGRLVPYKGFDVLVAAAGALPDDAVVVIGGGGPLAAALGRRIEAAGLGGRVVLAGRIPDAQLSDWFAACDIFCLPSTERAEMFGIVQLEAMAFGKPVVSTAIARSGVPAVNRDGITGLVVPPGDAVALGRALTRLLGDAALGRQLGQGGLAAVAGPYSPEAVAEAFGRAYACLYRDASPRL